MYILIFIVIILLIILLLNYIHERSFITPTFIMLVSFIAGTFLVLINAENWNISITPKLFVCIMLCILSWIITKIIVDKLTLKRTLKKDIQYHSKYPFHLLVLISIILFIFYFIYTTKNITLSTNIKDVLNQIYNSNDEGNFFVSQIIKILIILGYISSFKLIYSHYTCGKIQQKLSLLIVLVISILSMILSTDRNVIIRFLIFLFIVWVIFYQKKYKANISKANRHIFMIGITFAVSGVFLFYVLGKMKNYTSNFTQMIGIYGGSGIYNFNIFLDRFNGEHTYGLMTFKSILNTLNRFNLYPEYSSLIDPFIEFRSPNGYIYSSNIYSGLYPYYYDFGFLGIIIFSSIMSASLEALYCYYLNNKSVWSILLYSSFVYSAAFIAISDQFYLRLHLGLLYELFWLYFFYSFCFKRKIFFIRV